MKFLLILILSFNIFLIYGQESYVYVENERYKASKVIDYPSDLNIDQAYEKVLLWFGENFKNSEEVITSKTSNAIIGRYIAKYSYMASSIDFYHGIRIYFKEDRMKVIIDNVKTIEPGVNTLADYCLKNNGKVRGLYKKLYQQFDDNTKKNINSLESSLTNEGEMEGW